ncbi:MAG: hypothetical protein EON85_01205 [Brevundimonas sp.]|nr:MAG: hypothetical protein EON85_01205 [Brevundimonas sp.]
MIATLIVLALGALGVGIVVWATRRKPGQASSNAPHEADTAWNDPITPAPTPPSTPDESPRP